MPRHQQDVFVLFQVLWLNVQPAESGAVQLKSDNLDMTLGKWRWISRDTSAGKVNKFVFFRGFVAASNELVFINFYAEWCRFSNILQPIFDEAADEVHKQFPEAGKVVMGKVDCDKENSVATRFHITKYPTLKVIRNGQPMKREYRGQRSVEAFTEFIRKQMEDPIKEFKTLKDLEHLDSKKRIIIGYFDRRDMPEYNIFRRVATNMKEDCQFHVGFGDSVAQMHPPGNPIVVFRPDVAVSNENDETYTGKMNSFDEMNIWVQEKCVPLVREITFENAEELTEEGLPFLILFHATDDTDIIKDFKTIVETQLISEKRKWNLSILHKCLNSQRGFSIQVKVPIPRQLLNENFLTEISWENIDKVSSFFSLPAKRNTTLV